ncbi:MAG TPA: hypothetical protein DC046_18550, partial [Rhodospirillaceae bacterium]|nr:hypothetical protein [Rhodospirillaceae bacterium]
MIVRRSLYTVFMVLALAWSLCLMPLMSADAQAPVQVNVRAGAHATFTRVVFDWPTKVPYKLTKDGGLVTVIFEAAAQIDDADLNRNPPLFVGGIRSATEGGRTVSVIAVPPRSTVRDF